MSCITPPSIQSPLLHNRIIKRLQEDIATLSWLDNIYPLCNIIDKEVNGVKTIVPVVYGQNGDNNHIQIFPDTKERSGCFFAINGPGNLDRTGDQLITYEIDVIFWANLKMIANRDYDFTDQLITEAKGRFENGNFSSDITSIQWFFKHDQIFNEYGYTLDQFHSFMFPKTAFRIHLVMEVENESCHEEEDFGSSISTVC